MRGGGLDHYWQGTYGIIIIVMNQRREKGEYEKCTFDKPVEDKKI